MSCLEWSSSGKKSRLILRTHWHCFHLWWNPALKEAWCFLRGLICITTSPCHRGSVCRVTASRWGQERQSNRAFQAVFSKLNTGHAVRLSGSSVIAEKASSSHTHQRTNTNRYQFLLTRKRFQLRGLGEGTWVHSSTCYLNSDKSRNGNRLGSQFKLRQCAGLPKPDFYLLHGAGWRDFCLHPDFLRLGQFRRKEGWRHIRDMLWFFFRIKSHWRTAAWRLDFPETTLASSRPTWW